MTEQAPKTPAQLVEEFLILKDWVANEQKRLDEHLKPHKTRLEEIQNQLLALLNQQGCDSFSTDHGTAYKSTLLNVKVEDREKVLDLCNENWEAFGAEMLMVGVQKDAVKNYMDEHAGSPPPGVSTSWFTRVNIRRS